MIIYNVTVTVQNEIVEEWLNWIRVEHIPEVLSTGLFIDSVLKRVITNYNDESTFAVSYTCESMKKLHEYEVTWSKKLQKKHILKFGEKVTFFGQFLKKLKNFSL